MLEFWKRIFGMGSQQNPADGPKLDMLPERFVIFDLETTGLSAHHHEIIEIGAILANRDSDLHKTFQALVRPKRAVPKKITELTGITDEEIRRDGVPVERALTEFQKFTSGAPMIAFNLDFDRKFLDEACDTYAVPRFTNEMGCALRLSRRAWPERTSFRLQDLARDGGLSLDDSHRALGDCTRTLTIYIAAATAVGSWR